MTRRAPHVTALAVILVVLTVPLGASSARVRSSARDRSARTNARSSVSLHGEGCAGHAAVGASVAGASADPDVDIASGSRRDPRAAVAALLPVTAIVLARIAQAPPGHPLAVALPQPFLSSAPGRAPPAA